VTTKLRKNIDNLDYGAIAKDYADGKLSVNEIALKYSTTEHNIQLIANRFWKSLTNMKESRALIASGIPTSTKGSADSRKSLKDLRNTEVINNSFTRQLSSDTAALLSEAEATYSWVYVHTGSIQEALKLSKLDKGLFKEKGRSNRFSADRAVVLRGQYLNAKPNVATYIKELREQRFVDSDMGKARVQSELLDQLEYMKSSGDYRMRKDILRCIELLGKTVGAFVERVELTQVSPGDALDELIELAQEATVKELDEAKVVEVVE